MNSELLKVCCTLACSVRKINSAAFQYSDFYCFKCFTFQFREMGKTEDRIWSKWFYLEEEQHFKQAVQGWSDTGSGCSGLTPEENACSTHWGRKVEGNPSAWGPVHATVPSPCTGEGQSTGARRLFCLSVCEELGSVLVPSICLPWVAFLACFHLLFYSWGAFRTWSFLGGLELSLYWVNLLGDF